MKERYLIVNADDFGLSESVNRGILAAHMNGIVTSCSIMANGEAFQHAVRLALQTELGIGVHLTLVSGKPVSPIYKVKTLVKDNGEFYGNHSDFLRMFHQGKIKLSEMELELGAQIEKVVAAGISPTHFDSHQHLHAYPFFFPVVKRLCRRFDVAKIRIPAENYTLGRLSELCTRRAVERAVLTAVSRITAYRASRAGLTYPGRFAGMLYGGRLDKEKLAFIIRHLSPGVTEIMCHPGDDNWAMNKKVAWKYCWEQEKQALTDLDIQEALKKAGVKLISYREI